MKALKVLIPVALVLALGACAKPPQADIDAAKAAVDSAAKNADIALYAADTLKTAKDKLAQMQADIDAQAKKGAVSRRYDNVKKLALEAKSAAETAKTDAGRNKEQAKADATAMIDALKKAFPEAEKKIAAAKKVRGIALNFTALARQMANAKAAVAAAEKDLADGNYAAAKEKAASVQAQITEAEKAVADAVQAATQRKK
jgi:nitrate reductase alpha subunit